MEADWSFWGGGGGVVDGGGRAGAGCQPEPDRAEEAPRLQRS